MTWFSVHRELFTHPKTREAAKAIGCSQNEIIGCITRLWNWCFDNSDESGEIVNADESDIAEVLAYGLHQDLCAKRVVDVLIETEWIDKSEGVLYIHDWEHWQQEYYKMIKARKKNTERKRKERSEKRIALENMNQNEVKEVIQNGMETVLPTPKLNITPLEEPKQQTETITEYPEGFNNFWEVYPKKVGKGEAFKKYKARINCGWTPEQLLEAAKNYAAKVARERTDKQYIKHPKTFLSDSEPFVDFLPRESESVTVDNGSNSNEENPYANWR